MNDEQLEKYLKQVRFSKPTPELRQQILGNAGEHWLSGKIEEGNSQAHVNSFAFSRMFTYRFKRVFTVATAAVLLIASFSIYNNDIRQQRDNIARISSTGFLGDMIGERLETMTFSHERWYDESEERKMIITSIKKRFSPPGIKGKR
ncbi:hypothetical protein ACFL60_05025 [Candidatus Omnitrophota bacterium]